MRKKYIKLSEDETNILIKSLFEMRNDLIEKGKCADPVNDLILKLAYI